MEGFEQTAKAYLDRCFAERKSVTQSGQPNLLAGATRGNLFASAADLGAGGGRARGRPRTSPNTCWPRKPCAKRR